jgi:hypothetical protein
VDYFGLELVGGSLYVHMNLGSGPIRIQAARTRTLSDTEWHKVSISRVSNISETHKRNRPGLVNSLKMKS